MLETPQFLADRLVQEGGRVVNIFNQLRPDQWSIIVYPGQNEWDFHHLLAHFVSAEIGRRELIQDVCSHGEGVSTGFDIDRFNHSEVEHYSNFSSLELIDRFFIARQELVNTVSKLSSDDLRMVGRDPFLGLVPVSEMIKLTYRHLQIHLRDVRRLLE